MLINNHDIRIPAVFYNSWRSFSQIFLLLRDSSEPSPEVVLIPVFPDKETEAQKNCGLAGQGTQMPPHCVPRHGDVGVTSTVPALGAILSRKAQEEGRHSPGMPLVLVFSALSTLVCC